MVTIENAPCGMEGASCVKAVVLEDGMNVVRLRRGHQVLINGQEVTEFPKTVGNIFVNQPTKHQTAVSEIDFAKFFLKGEIYFLDSCSFT